MHLEGKALSFAILAFEHYANHLEAQCDDEAVDEDTRADAGNDMMYLREVLKTLRGAQKLERG